MLADRERHASALRGQGSVLVRLPVESIRDLVSQGNERVGHPVVAIHVLEVKQRPGLPSHVGRTEESSLSYPIPPTPDNVRHHRPLMIRPAMGTLVIRHRFLSPCDEIVQDNQYVPQEGRVIESLGHESKLLGVICGLSLIAGSRSLIDRRALAGRKLPRSGTFGLGTRS